MARWHKAASKLRDGRYAELTASARGVFAGLEELLDEEPVIGGYLKSFASWMCIDRKVMLTSLKAIQESGLLQIAEKEERGKTVFIVQRPEGFVWEAAPGRLQGQEWQDLRVAIFQRDGYTCQYCRMAVADPECDHIMPISRGGSNHPSNLATTCKPCNRSKGAKTLSEWRPGNVD
jgi:hypothetical protein